MNLTTRIAFRHLRSKYSFGFISFSTFLSIIGLILGFILGSMLEKNLRRALLINDGSYSFLWERPISLFLFILMIAIILLQIYQGIKIRQAK